MNNGPRSIVVVCEALADFRTASDLADRVLHEEVDWIEPEVIDDYRQWRGVAPGETYLRWASVRKMSQDRRIQAHGHFDGEPSAQDARTARLALLLILASDEETAAILLIRDTDGNESRLRGLEQARKAFGCKTIAVVIGAAHPKRECWALAGFDPQNDAERDRLSAMRSDLGFDPTVRADRLNAKEEIATRNLKRVLSELIDNDPHREESCWKDAPLATLKERGEKTGLSAYLGELQSRLVPIFTGHPSRD